MTITTILLVDDDGNYMNELEEFLVRNDFTVIKKNSTHKVLPFIKKNKPDLIILDYKINGMTGIDVSRILNNDPDTKDIPIMLVSNYHNSGSYEYKNNDSGIRIYLQKSSKPEVLLQEIRKIEIN
ncbi:MAG: response regulator [Spirochaetales bacterium]|nr:response regulator [Spirochaetales bacterium]